MHAKGGGIPHFLQKGAEWHTLVSLLVTAPGEKLSVHRIFVAESMAESVGLDAGMAGRNRPCPTAEFPVDKVQGVWRMRDGTGCSEFIVLINASMLAKYKNGHRGRLAAGSAPPRHLCGPWVVPSPPMVGSSCAAWRGPRSRPDKVVTFFRGVAGPNRV